MNEKYGGLVSNPRNTKDTQVVKSITYTTNGTVVETVNLNAWPAAIEGNTPEPTPTPSLYYKVVSGMTVICDSEGKAAYVQMGTTKYALNLYYSNWMAVNTYNGGFMQEPLTVLTSGPSNFEYEEFSFTMTGSGLEWRVSPDVTPLE